MKLNRQKLVAEVPTSSMADIAFLLIVFFMLTTVFSANSGIEHHLPRQSELHAIPESAIHIQIKPSGDFRMNNTDYSAAQSKAVYDHVMQKVSHDPKKPVIIQTHRDAKYGDMVRIMDQLKKAESKLGQPISITIPSKEEIERYPAITQ